MTNLSTRAQQAKPEEARGLLEELYDNCPYAWKGANALAAFDALLDIGTPEAHLAAAMMLVPEGHGWVVSSALPKSRANVWELSPLRPIASKHTTAATPALALIAAIAKAQEAQ